MGCNVREKSIRNNHRKLQHVPIKPENTNPSDPTTLTAGSALKTPNPLESTIKGMELPNPNPNFDDTGWGYCTEEQLEELLLKNLHFLYKEAISKLVSLGYDEDIALKSILQNGHCYGSMDVMTNILHNAMAYIYSIGCDDDDGDDEDGVDNGGNSDKPESGFADLREMEEYSLAHMVGLLQQVRPQLSRGDAMWCLLMNDLHVGRASTMEIPALSSDNITNAGVVNAHVPPGICKLHGSGGFGGAELPAGGLAYDPTSVNFSPAFVNDIECSNRFNLSPSMKTLLKRNVAFFSAGFRASTKAAVQLRAQSRVCSSSSSSHGSHLGVAAGSDSSMEKYQRRIDTQKPDMMSTIMGSLGNMTIDDKSDGTVDQKEKMISNLADHIRELEVQLKEQKEWAQQKAMQAAKKVSSDLTELKLLRMEREETLRLKKGKQALEDTTMKRLSEMENALRKASGQVDRANAAVKRLETENAEIRAEMEAFKLSASESVTTCLEFAKREKKCHKKLLAWEKQKDKLQEEIAEEKQKIEQVQQQLLLSKEAQKEAEIKWRQELKAKDLAFARLEEERRSKEAADASVKRREEALRYRIEIDSQRYKDDIQRLEQELSHLKASAEGNRPSNAFSRELDTLKTIKWRQELKAKELAIARLEEEQRSKEAAEASVKRGEDAFRSRIEMDSQCYKDDIQRLEQELSHLKASAEAILPSNAFARELDTSKTVRETHLTMLHDMLKLQEPSRKEVGRNRKCLICMKNEVSVIFLPCAHQILCAGCNKDHEKEAKTDCPCCRMLVEERIRVYGANS